MKAYSLDFRQKIIDVYHNEPISQKAIAKRFFVALSCVQKLIKQVRQTQNIAPQTSRCGAKLKLNEEQIVSLKELIEENNDATLEELRYLLYQKIGVSVSRATMGRMTKVLNMTMERCLCSDG